jgi:sugar O-acyltransferase (sialic acid O-acetyltransferase NeuD family)
MKTLYLCGAGNSEGVRLALRVNQREPRWDRIVLLDDDPAKRGGELLGVPIVGPFEALADADLSRDEAVNLVARTTRGRRSARERIASFGIRLTGLVAPGVDTLGAELAPDVLVYPQAMVGPEVRVGAGSVVFMGAVLGHEARVGEGCVVAANAVLNARVHLGEGVYVGSNATLLPEIAVGADATIGAGSSVIADVEAGSTVIGVPARALTGPGNVTPRRRGPSDPEAVERVLTAQWAEVLGVDAVPPDVPIFEWGATSLTALRVAGHVSAELGIEVSVVDVFRFPTLRGLAAHLAAAPVRREPAADRAAAPSPSSAAPAPTKPPPASVAPLPDDLDLVAEVTRIFREVLHRGDLGPDSHFFDGGGTPVSAQKAALALQEVTGEPLCFMQVARHPTPVQLARHLEASLGQPPSCPAQGVMNRLIHRHEWEPH